MQNMRSAASPAATASLIMHLRIDDRFLTGLECAIKKNGLVEAIQASDNITVHGNGMVTRSPIPVIKPMLVA